MIKAYKTVSLFKENKKKNKKKKKKRKISLHFYYSLTLGKNKTAEIAQITTANRQHAMASTSTKTVGN